MKLRAFSSLIFAAVIFVNFPSAASPLDDGWQNPPNEARLRAYWWWLNGNVTQASITHDLEEMKAKGFGGAVLIDAGGAAQEGNAQRAARPDFFHAGVARALQTCAARSRPARSGNELEHPERLESRRAGA